MYEHLDDPRNFSPDDAFRVAVARRGRLLRARRRKVVSGICAAMVVGGGASVAAFEAASGPRRETLAIGGPAPSDATEETSAAVLGNAIVVDDPTVVTASSDVDALTAPINLLVTASDGRECVDPDSLYADSFGPAEGVRADTIMIVRLEPLTGRVALLSVPRDLWVDTPGSYAARINSVLVLLNPQLLIDTIGLNLRLSIDHFVNVDFCGFGDIVDAVGGVRVPFSFASRDTNTGLFVEEPGCRLLNRDEALAYVRSRRFQWLDPATQEWLSDNTSDLGRIARQQDFVVRLLTRVMESAGDSDNRLELAETFVAYATTDSGLTFDVLRDINAAFANVDPTLIERHQVPVEPFRVGGASVLRLADSAESVLSSFRNVVPGEPMASPVETSQNTAVGVEPDAAIPMIPPAISC